MGVVEIICVVWDVQARVVYLKVYVSHVAANAGVVNAVAGVGTEVGIVGGSIGTNINVTTNVRFVDG